MIFIVNIYIAIAVFKTVYLIELSPVEDNVIMMTEANIRDIINKIVKMFDIEEKSSLILKHFLLIHNKLLSTSLQDAENWNEVVKSAKVDVPGDMTNIVADVINSITNFTDCLNKPVHEDDLIKLIDTFLQEVDFYNTEYRNEIIVESYLQNDLILRDTNSNEIYPDIREDSYENYNESSEIWHHKSSFTASGRRIYASKTTTVKKFPFVVAVYVFGQFRGGGAIVSSDLIVTAASGVQLAYNNRLFRENPSFLEVRVGSNYHALGGELITIQEAYFHPAYDPRTLENNICLLRLARHINLSAKRNKKVKKIEFDKTEAGLPLNTPEIILLGWGAKSPGNRLKLEGAISYAHLGVYSLSDCRDIYSKKYVTKRNFCAGFVSRGGGACNQDVGDPAIVDGILYGIVSFGAPVCGSLDSPTVFTKIGFYADWMESIIEQNVPTKNRHYTTARISTIYTLDEETFQYTTSRKVPMEHVLSGASPTPYQNLEVIKDVHLNPSEHSIEFIYEQDLNFTTIKPIERQKIKHQVPVTEAKYEEENPNTKETKITNKHHHKHKQDRIPASQSPSIIINNILKGISKKPHNHHLERTTSILTDYYFDTTTHAQIVRQPDVIPETNIKTKKPKRIRHSKKKTKHKKPISKLDRPPLISKYKLRDLLRPIQPKQNYTTDQKGLEYSNKKIKETHQNNEYGIKIYQSDSESVETFHRFKNDSINKDEINDNISNLEIETYKISQKRNLSDHQSNPKKKLIIKQVETNHSKDHGNTTTKHQNLKYYNVTPSHNKNNSKQNNLSDDYLNSNSDYYYEDLPKKYHNIADGGKNVDSYKEFEFSEPVDIYEDYDFFDKNKIHQTKNDSFEILKRPYISYSDYNSIEEKYNETRLEQMLTTPEKIYRDEKIRKPEYKEDSFYYDYDYKKKHPSIISSNFTDYSDYEDIDKEFEDYVEHNAQKPKKINMRQHGRENRFLETTLNYKYARTEETLDFESSKEFEGLGSYELKQILKQLLSQPEGYEKNKLLKELLKNQKKIAYSKKNQATVTTTNDPIGELKPQSGGSFYEVLKYAVP